MSTTPKVSEYLTSWKWLIGGLACFLVTGALLGGIYYYRVLNMSTHVLHVAEQINKEAHRLRDDQKLSDAYRMQEDAVNLLLDYNRSLPPSQPKDLAILSTLDSIMQEMLDGEGGSPAAKRALMRRIKENLLTVIQNTPSDRESLEYRERLMQLEWELNDDIVAVMNRAREVLRIQYQVNGQENYKALRYIALVSLIQLPSIGYNPPQTQVPLPIHIDTLFEKVHRMSLQANEPDVQIAYNYAEMIMNVENQEKYRNNASPELREMSNEKRRQKAKEIMNDMVARNPREIRAYLARYVFNSLYNPPTIGSGEIDADLISILKIDPTHREALIFAGDYSLRQANQLLKDDNKEAATRKLQDAENYYKKAIESSPTNGLAYQSLGDYYIKQGNIDEAIRIWNQGIERILPMANEELIGRLAIALIEKQRFKEAEAMIQNLNQSIQESRLLRAGSVKQVRSMVSLLTARLYAYEGAFLLNKAEDAQKLGNKDEAREMFLQSQKRIGESTRILSDLLGSFGKASSHDYVVEGSSVYASLLPESLMLAGRLMIDQGKWDQAIFYFEAARPFPSVQDAAQMRAADAYQRAGRSDDAVRLLADAVNRNPENIAIRDLYTQTLFQRQMRRSDSTLPQLNELREQLVYLSENKDQLQNPWGIELRLIHLDLVRESLSTNTEESLQAHQRAIRRLRELENKEFSASKVETDSNGSAADTKTDSDAKSASESPKRYSDDLMFLAEIAGVYSSLSAMSDFDRVLEKMRELPNGENAYFNERINDAIRRSDREGAIQIIAEAHESELLTSVQKQRFAALMESIGNNDERPIDRIYQGLKTTFDQSPESLKPQAFFILANLAIDRDDLEFAKTLQERLLTIEGESRGTMWRYVKARILLAEKEIDFDLVRQIQNDLAQRAGEWDMTYLLKAMIEERYLQGKQDDIDIKNTLIDAYKQAIRCGNTRPPVWNRLLSLYEEINKSEESLQLQREARVRGIALETGPGIFPQPYQRMYSQVHQFIQDEALEDADTTALQCIALAAARRERPRLVFDLNLEFGKLFLDANFLESARRHLEAVAKRGGTYVYPLAVCLVKNQQIDDGFNLILDEMEQMPSSVGTLVPSMLILFAQTKPSESVLKRMDEVMTKIEKGNRPAFETDLVNAQQIDLGTRYIRTLELVFPKGEVPPAESLQFDPPEEEHRIQNVDETAAALLRENEVEIHFIADQTPTDAPTIKPIPNGYFVIWPRLTDVKTIRWTGPVSGPFRAVFDVAEKDVGKIEEPTKDPNAILPLADYWLMRNNPRKAIELYRIGMNVDPENLRFQNNLAMLLSSELGENDEAISLINKALESRIDNVTLLDSKGMILMNAGRPDESLPVLRRAVELSCQHPIYVLHYANAYDMVGDETSARNWFEKARPLLEENPDKMMSENKEMFDQLRRRYGSNTTE
ncbi:MAG: tetratricopeptide repeat protein [Thermoguttaceae bacterium]